MNIIFSTKKLNQTSADCEVVFIINKNFKHKWAKDDKRLDQEGFKGEAEQAVVLVDKARIYIGVENLESDNIRQASAFAIKVLAKKKFKSIKIGLYGGSNLKKNTQAMVEGFLLGAYNFNKYKSKPDNNPILKIQIAKEEYENKEVDESLVKQAINEGRILAQATNYVRDIVNLAPNDLTPLEMSKFARELGKDLKIETKIYGDDFLKKEGMGAFLAVSQASQFPAQLIHFIYKPNPSIRRFAPHSGQVKKIAIVGKGLTYDSGGLSLKPSAGMLTMKSDEAGAAVVFGIMKAVSELKLPFEIHGIAGVTENVISDEAFKPDDVLRAKNGTTIEVRNTDAEGRLVLADCLCYAQEFKPDYIIDIATLTGACKVALGDYTIGVMGFNQDIKNSFQTAGENSGELIGDLPFNKYLPKLLKSEVADLSNISSSSYGGAITAALFLSNFIEKKNQNNWIHLDIAGPSYSEKPWGCFASGASGAGVRLVVEWLKELS